MVLRAQAEGALKALRSLALAGLALAPLGLGASLGPRYGGELRVGVLEVPLGLEPAPTRGASGRLALGLAHETLVGLAPGGLPAPGLASEWTSAAGGREWTLSLRPGARFHDDEPVTAEAVVRSLRRFLRAPSSAADTLAEELDGGRAYRSGSAADLPGLDAPDPLRVRLRLQGPVALPLAPLSSASAAVQSSSGAGSGPFLPTIHVPGRSLTLTAFAGHVRGRAYVDRIQIVSVPEAALLRSALQGGRVNLAEGGAGVSSLAATLLLILDPSRPPFDRPEARQAVGTAIDRADLVRNLLPGGDPVPSLLTPGLLPPLPDPPRPPPARLHGTLLLAVGRDLPRIVSQRVVACLGALGLEVAVVPASPSEAFAVPAGARLVLFSPEVAEPLLALRELMALRRPVESARDALARAAAEADPARRRAELQRAEAALRADDVLLPLASVPVSFGAGPGVHGASVDLSGRLVLEDAWLEP